jgi:integrase
MRLTAANVKTLTIPPGKSELLVFDDAVKGFGIRLRAGGKRTWVVQYRVGARQRRVSLGRVENLDLEKARKTAKDTLAKATLGTDTRVELKIAKSKATETLGALVESYIDAYGDNFRPRTLEEVTRSLRRHWKPLHNIPAHQITRAAVAVRLSEIARASGPFAANRSRAYLNALFNWGLEQGKADTNPVAGTGRATDEKSRDRVLSDDELALVLQCAGDGQYGDVLRMLVLTGQRREEVAAMAWSEINLAAALWTIPGRRTKNGRPHEVPLSAQAIEILSTRDRVEGRDLVFGTRNGPFSGWSKAKAALDARIAQALASEAQKGKPPAAWRVHDLRRTAATRMADFGVQPHVIEAILNHISGSKAGVAGIYNRATYSTEKRAALDLWSCHIADLVNNPG